MERKEFLALIGAGATALVYTACLNGCKPLDNVTDPPAGVDFTLNLDDPAYSALKSNGGFVSKDGVIVARTTSGTYIAVSLACTHEGTAVTFDSANSRFHCPNHGSNFSTTGSVLNGPASSPLTSYQTSLNGSSLHVFS
jgi:cytochrome b6-f complex iron-sulfur subunit